MRLLRHVLAVLLIAAAPIAATPATAQAARSTPLAPYEIDAIIR